MTTETSTPADDPTPGGADIVVVPHTHWDREWYEPHDVFRLRLVHVLDDLITRLEADSAFRFTLDGQAAAIEDYLEVRPENLARVQALVRGGQLAVGPFLILLDEFCCDGETIVRNLELGHTAAAGLGDVMPVGYLPDMFGHTAQMPQILRGFGIRHAALWRGVPGRVQEHAFGWAAPDGSVVRCEYLFDGYGSGLPMFAVRGQLAELSALYRRDTRSWYGTDPVLAMYGTDHMAPPPEFMDRVRAHNAEVASTGAPRLEVQTLAQYLAARSDDDAARAALPQVRGELRSHARGNLLPGVFSIRTNLKAAMAQAELILTQAERLDALYSAEDHRSFFDLAWHRVVESSAHDSVTGCGVDATADQVGSRLLSAANVGRGVIDRVTEVLASSVPADAHLLVNTLPWRRTLQAEVVVESDGAATDGVQVLGELPTVLGDEQLTSAELVKVLRRIHGRELFGQLIAGYTWSPGELHFHVAERPEGPFDFAALAAEISAVMERPDATDTVWRVRTTARRRRRVLIEAEVPALGHVAVRPNERSALPAGIAARATTSHLSNGLVDVDVQPDGTLVVHGTDGAVLRGVGRLVDEGDRGDSYNYGPLAKTAPLDTPAAVDVRLLADGPLRGGVEVERRYDVPRAVDPVDRDRRTEETEPLVVRTLVEVRAREPFVRLTIDLVNTTRDHRLRLMVPLGETVQESFAAGQFDITRRGRTAEGGWGEYPLPTFPATGFVSAGSAHVLLAKLTEYEVVSPSTEPGDELALTLLRSVGMMSVNVHPLRDEPAGSEFAVPGAQYLGTAVSTRLAVLPHPGGWEAAEVAHWAEVFRHEAIVRCGSAPAGEELPAPVAGPSLTGPAVLTSLRAVDAGDGVGIEARVVSVSDGAASVTLTPPRGAAGWQVTDLRGRAVAGASDDTLPARSIRTLRTPGAAGSHRAVREHEETAQ